MTQMDEAKKGIITEEMKAIAKKENVPEDFIRRGVANGRIIIPSNINREVKPVGIGEGLRTKVNATIGTSTDIIDLKMEEEKAKIAIQNKADTLMELSVGGNLDKIRKRILEISQIPVGSVPVYQAAIETIRKKGAAIYMDEDILFKTIEKQAKDGIDFMAIHCSINMETLKRLKRQGREGGLVSRGGAFISAWIVENETENPLYKDFDYILEIAKEHDFVLSLANGMRAGAIADATDRAQVQELIILGELIDKSREAGVQAMVEGPGHIPLNEIKANVILQKKLCRGAPFYMLGPIVTDIAPGYDHVVAAIGAAASAAAGADFICYVTPAEHLALPYPEDVKEGVIATRIGAYVGDMSRGIHNGEKDLLMANARKKLDWEAQFDVAMCPADARRIREERPPADPDTCTMCGEYCAVKIVNEWLESAEEDIFTD
ncbi:phosphomethylpyrimidine synthase [Methanothermobacter tenebrarum]|uniref:Phosphomethylpyrimidine synthase n=1 Tax=Methanothermobacter tenebrarum TaxID=680118 RepID=A0ABN6PG36_9EURY|nr:phosphomethylpyrimidine synthase [Methanothermobacter tenebrarum]MDD3454357.1 phosphomethylpyrimidine synthase [Methanobacteriales archaeon]MDX9694094.1 phosphomethylpyrimidine synthase [Methanothermobacter sp.]BDH80185.1 phosphomethylpyrimidine synthase [Methanothermobacter tenebrarum]HHW04379.1 phosphomethylpyrimidine synthase [Methanothermobacter sp.]